MLADEITKIVQDNLLNYIKKTISISCSDRFLFPKTQGDFDKEDGNLRSFEIGLQPEWKLIMKKQKIKYLKYLTTRKISRGNKENETQNG